MRKNNFNQKLGFSLAEAMITLLIVCIIAIASAPVITKRHKIRTNIPHGAYACYWNGDTLVAKYIMNGTISDGKVVYDNEEGRYGCEFNPPPNSKSFVATIVGGGGGGAGAGVLQDGVKKIYTEPGDYIFKTPYSGVYEMLAVGAGGGGGDGKSDNRGCTGNTGAYVYIPPIVLTKDINFSIQVGRGGSHGDAYARNLGRAGGNTTITKDDTSDVFANAEGGGGGCSFNLVNNEEDGYIKGYNYLGKIVSYGAVQMGDAVSYNYSIPITWSNYKSYWNRVGSGPIAAAKSSLANAKQVKGSNFNNLGSTTHQIAEYDYRPINDLALYSDKFGVDFNKSVRTNTINVCNGKKYLSYCNTMSNMFGAGGGGGGNAGWFDNMSPMNGKSGFAAFAYKPVFAGLGGNAGNVAQIPYADMPQKTLLFPGKGGKGGRGSVNIQKSGINYFNNSQTAGSDGEDSYIKNGAHILNGTGASKIIPGVESTFSSDYSESGFPIGENGKLSDVLTSKKIGTGGLGGLNNGNNTINGLTQTVFENGAVINGFIKIFGAGAGGGGGAISADNAEAVYAGNGGNGTSGLVFIQW